MGKNKVLLLISSIVIIMVCGVLIGVHMRSNKSDYEEMPIYMENVLMASGVTSLITGEEVTVNLIMVEGEFYDEEYAGAGGGTYPSNYHGSYDVEIVSDSGSVLGRFELSDYWTEAVTGFNFPGQFTLQFADYNQDGNPDFTLGQYGSSSMNVFEIFSINAEGALQLISKDTIASDTKDFSVVFNQINKEGTPQLVVPIWDNGVGKEKELIYIWSNEEKSFILK